MKTAAIEAVLEKHGDQQAIDEYIQLKAIIQLMLTGFNAIKLQAEHTARAIDQLTLPPP